ncbi:MFS transporter [Virgibacillus ndiopensis]|uniref:MFS transporter n=1 Tax=Virgibacillus ndiopensis TaxID=2004408 RepID=UPI000C0845B2|nr:MFS transporter [Virgibacillus ndiopensis]
MQYQTYTIRDFYFWKITLSLALASFFIFASMYSVQPLLPVFVKEFGVSVSTASLAISLTIIGLIVGLIVLGFLSDRNGRTLFIKFSLIGSVIPFLLIPLTDSFLLLLVLRLIQGFALAGLPAASLAYLSEEIDRRSVSVATALYISSNALGGMMGRVLTGYITDHYSWEVAFYFLAGLGVIILASVFLLLPKSRFFQPSNLSFSRDMEAFFFHLKNPALLLVFGLGIVLQFSFTGIWTYLPFHLEGPPFSLSLQAISYTFFAYGLGVVGSPFAGWLAGNLGIRKIRIVGVVTLSIGILLTLSQTVTMIVIGLCVSCLGFFTAHSLTAASVSEQATHHKGSASSLYLVAYYIGVAIGSSALGPLWSVAGWTGLVVLTGILPVAYLVFVNVMSVRARKNATN